VTAPGGFSADPPQIRAHAANVEAVAARFGAVKGASAHITQDDQAYGALCGWISGILEGRHTKQNELFAHVEKNLTSSAAELRKAATGYEEVDDDADSSIKNAGRGVG
jgi:hypothetical protein